MQNINLEQQNASCIFCSWHPNLCPQSNFMVCLHTFVVAFSLSWITEICFII